MDFGYFKLVCLMTWWYCGNTSGPLHLTPLIDEGKINLAVELSEVKDPLMLINRSYSGFITTDRKSRNHLFFWFFPAVNDTKAPLMVWLNGGPTVSSMFGLLYENGPIRTKTLGNGDIGYERRPQSWADPFSMLYIDNPVGIGYSYSETNSYKTKQDEYSQELYLFIEQFYLLFPDYLHRELYIGGQSYAGKYVPAFAHQIHTRILENKSVIPLTGIYMGGPYFDPLVQSAHFCDYYYSMGAIAYSQLIKCKQNINELSNLVNYGNLENENYRSLFDKAFPRFTNGFSRDNYASRETPGYEQVEKLMKQHNIRKALHVNDIKYKVANNDVILQFLSDLFVSTKSKLAVLLDNYKVLIFTGDFDGLLTSPMVEAALMTTPWSLQEQYNISARSLWKVGAHINGFYTKTGQFCRVVVHGAGHQVPHDQPKSALEMMINFVQNGCILNKPF